MKLPHTCTRNRLRAERFGCILACAHLFRYFVEKTIRNRPENQPKRARVGFIFSGKLVWVRLGIDIGQRGEYTVSVCFVCV